MYKKSQIDMTPERTKASRTHKITTLSFLTKCIIIRQFEGSCIFVGGKRHPDFPDDIALCTHAMQ